MRGRIFTVASVWIGRPLFSISIVTRPVWPSRLIEATLPTSTPAMRTGDFEWMFTAELNWALSRKPCLNGMCLVKPK